MNYVIDIYEHSEDNKLRFVLGKNGTNPLYVSGLNPSTADKNKSDRTMDKVQGFAERTNHDGFIVLNLYPQRATRPHEMDDVLDEKKHQANLKAIETLLKGKSKIDVLVAFGNDISVKKYLKTCFKDIASVIQKANPNWLQIGSLTAESNPRHPSRAKYAEGVSEFDINKYLQQKN